LKNNKDVYKKFKKLAEKSKNKDKKKRKIS
jgi:hypothetical protein